MEGKSVDSVKRTPKPKGGGEGNDALPRNEDKHQGRSDVIDGSLPEAGRETTTVEERSGTIIAEGTIRRI